MRGRARRKRPPKFTTPASSTRRVEMLRLSRRPPPTFRTPLTTPKTAAMASQTRSSKRNHDSVEPESPLSARASQRKKKPSYKALQSTIPFAPKAPSQLSQVTTPRRRRSPTPISQEASRETSLSPTPRPSQASSIVSIRTSKSSNKNKTIKALRRVVFDVDYNLVGHEYTERSRTHRSVAQSQVSWIYLYGIELEKDKARYWLCKPCHDVGKSKVLSAVSTAGCSRHLNKHGIYAPGTEASSTSASAGNTTMDTYLEGVYPLQAERWREDFINWITYDNISFEQAASPWLRKVILGGGTQVQHLLPCARTVRSWLTSTYSDRIAEVRTSLARGRSRVVLSFDAWSSPNHYSLLGVVAHWIDADRQLRTGLLALKVLEGHHGIDMAEVLQEVIASYNIEDRIGAFQMDNATNNDTALDELASNIPGVDCKQSRLRCFGHIINIVVKALLFGTGSASLQQQLGEAGDDEAFKVWREQGAIGKLHNIVFYITRSDRRRRALEASQKVDSSDLTLQLVRDIGVRWNSTYAMIQRALRLKDALHRYCKHWRPVPSESYDLRKDMLDAADWDELTSFNQLLMPFDKATKRAEGNAITGSHGALWEVIPVMDYLFNTLKLHADDIAATPSLYSDHYKHCINHGFVKLQEYCTKIDDSRFYSAATALNPYMKFNYFDDAWTGKQGGREAIANARRMTRELYEEYLARAEQSAPASITPASTTLFVSQGPDDEEDPLWAATFGNRTTSPEQERIQTRKLQETELERFMSDSLDTTTTTTDATGKIIKQQMEPLRWWRERGEHLYPTLAVMAYDLFAMPAMSSECERTFSSAKRLIAEQRYNLKSDIIEADQCIKSWLKSGIANGQAIFNNIAAAIDDEIVDIT